LSPSTRPQWTGATDSAIHRRKIVAIRLSLRLCDHSLVDCRKLGFSLDWLQRPGRSVVYGLPFMLDGFNGYDSPCGAIGCAAGAFLLGLPESGDHQSGSTGISCGTRSCQRSARHGGVKWLGQKSTRAAPPVAQRKRPRSGAGKNAAHSRRISARGRKSRTRRVFLLSSSAHRTLLQQNPIEEASPPDWANLLPFLRFFGGVLL
jgi:hypothetical protein